MKANNLLFILMAALCLTLCEQGNCRHIHTEECGENGASCQHVCKVIEPRREEHIKL